MSIGSRSLRPTLIARQPILDRSLRIFGFELLFRPGPSSRTAAVVDGDASTAQVVLNAFLEIGLDRVVGGRPAFFNATRGFLVNGFARQLPRDRVVVEILEDVPADAEVLAAVSELHAAGYTIALDDVDDLRAVDALLPYAQIAKLDIEAFDEAGLQRHVERLRREGLMLVAERVATRRSLDRCRALGFDLFQGFFLAEPTVVGGRGRGLNRLSALRLFGLLEHPETPIERLEAAIGADPRLGYRLLRVVNSACFGLFGQVDSLRQAIVLLGRDRIRTWVSLMLLSRLSEKPQALVTTALVRARMCELLGAHVAGDRTHACFTVGLFSALDALFDAPMADLLEPLPLSQEVTTALLRREGPLGEVLSATLAYERGDWDAVRCGHVDDDAFRQAYLDAVAWASELERAVETV